MADWATLFKNFIYRDVAFILGGSIVLASVAYCFDLWNPNNALRELPIPYVILFAAFAYVVGYAVQDIGGVIGVSNTAVFLIPCFLDKYLYKRFTRMDWADVDFGNSLEFEIDMGRRNIPPRTLQALERIVSLKVIGMCIGACLLVSALFVLLHRPVQWLLLSGMSFGWPEIGLTKFFSFDVVLSLVCFVFGVALIFLGRLKAMQETQFNQAMKTQDYLRSEQTNIKQT